MYVARNRLASSPMGIHPVASLSSEHFFPCMVMVNTLSSLSHVMLMVTLAELEALTCATAVAGMVMVPLPKRSCHSKCPMDFKMAHGDILMCMSSYI